MRILFSKIFADAPDAYIRAKLTSWAAQGQENPPAYEVPPETISAVIEHLGTHQVPLATPEEKYPLTPAQATVIRTRTKCLFDTLERCSPLTDGEVLIEDRLSYFTSPLDDMAVNTVALRRTTNQAELFYFIPEIQIVDGNVVEIQEAEPEAETHAKAAAVEAMDSSWIPTIPELAKNFSFGIASWAGGAVAAQVFKAVMPGDGVPTYFDAVYAQISEIIEAKLKQETINTINGKLNGVNAWVQDSYLHSKADPKVTLIKLSHDLGEQERFMYNEVIGPLTSSDYAQPGFTVFMLAASMHLALIQEEALVDPAHKGDPKSSAKAKTVAESARRYREHADVTYNKIVEKRKSYISMRYYPPKYTSTGGSTTPFYQYRDDYIGLKSKWWTVDTKDPNSKDGNEWQCRWAMEKYTGEVLADLSASLKDPMANANNWKLLETTPIPTPK